MTVDIVGRGVETVRELKKDMKNASIEIGPEIKLYQVRSCRRGWNDGNSNIYSKDHIDFYVNKVMAEINPATDAKIIEGRAAPVIKESYTKGYNYIFPFDYNEKGNAGAVLVYLLDPIERDELKPRIQKIDSATKKKVDFYIEQFETELISVPEEERLSNIRYFRSIVRDSFKGKFSWLKPTADQNTQEIHDTGILIGLHIDDKWYAFDASEKESAELYFFYRVNAIERPYAKKVLQDSGLRLPFLDIAF